MKKLLYIPILGLITPLVLKNFPDLHSSDFWISAAWQGWCLVFFASFFINN